MRVLNTMLTLIVLVGGAHAANATFDSFNDPSLALPRSEKANPRDDARSARMHSDEYDPFNDPRQAVPFTEERWPDISVAKP